MHGYNAAAGPRQPRPTGGGTIDLRPRCGITTRCAQAPGLDKQRLERAPTEVGYGTAARSEAHPIRRDRDPPDVRATDRPASHRYRPDRVTLSKRLLAIPPDNRPGHLWDIDKIMAGSGNVRGAACP